MATALDLVKGAMRLIGVLAEGETPEADDANVVLSALNAMLDSWNLESLMIYHVQDEAFSLTPGVGTYAIGAGQAFSTTRPVSIESAYLRDSSNNDQPLDVFEYDMWDQIPDKNALGRPNALSYEPSFPYGQVKLWPAPDSAYTLHIRTFKPLNTALALATQISVPAGYERAIRFNLAVETAPEFGKEASPSVQNAAVQALRMIKTQNTRVPQMGLGGVPVPRGFNIVSGN